MNKDHAHDLLLEYLYGELDPGRAAEMERHLAHCNRCRAEKEETEKLLGAYRALPGAKAPPDTAAIALAAAHAETGGHALPPPASSPAGKGAKMLSPGRRPAFHPAWGLAAALVLVVTLVVAVPDLRKSMEENLAPAPARDTPGRFSSFGSKVKEPGPGAGSDKCCSSSPAPAEPAPPIGEARRRA